MKLIFTITTVVWILILISLGLPTKSHGDEVPDDNVAMFEGKALTYVIYPPAGFKLVLDEAMGDGYSMAFIPEDRDYTNTTAMVSVNIFSAAGNRRADLLDQFIIEDSAEMRAFYGDSVLIMPVDSLQNAAGEILTGFFLDDKSSFLPHVMSAYYGNPKSGEILVFELHINEDYPRFKAEEVFVNCLHQFKTLKRGKLDEK